MKPRRVIFRVLGAVSLIFLIFLLWYVYEFSMGKAETYERFSSAFTQSVLIASQGSEYKNKMVEELRRVLEPSPVNIRVIDVSELSKISVESWDAIIILHTWEVWRPQKDAARFLDQFYDPAKVFVVTTSGSGEEKIEGVDAITGSSIITEIPGHISELESKLNTIIIKK